MVSQRAGCSGSNCATNGGLAVNREKVPVVSSHRLRAENLDLRKPGCTRPGLTCRGGQR